MTVEDIGDKLARLNLTANPFEDFELFDEKFDPDIIEIHKRLFKDRRELLERVEYGIMSASSYKAILHGDLGVGKSSALNKISYDLRAAGYFAVKYRLTELAASDPSYFERDLLRAFGESIVRETLRSKGLRGLLESIMKMKTRRDLKQLALLATLYSSGQITVKEGTIDTSGISATVGIPFLKSEISDEEQRYVEVARSEVLSHMVFERLIRELIGLLGDAGYKGTMIAIDEVDKLKDEELEKKVLSLIKDTFYPAALSHVLIVMATRDGREMIHPDIFNYEIVRPLSKADVVAFLNELYLTKAFDRTKPLSEIIDQRLTDQIYENNGGKIRNILKNLSNCIVAAMSAGASKIDNNMYRKAVMSDPLYSYLRTLKVVDIEHKVLSYLIKKNWTYSRDPNLAKYCDSSRNTLHKILRELSERGILVSKKDKRKVLFGIDASLRSLVKNSLI